MNLHRIIIAVCGLALANASARGDVLHHWSFDLSGDLGHDSTLNHDLATDAGAPAQNTATPRFGAGALQLDGSSSMLGPSDSISGSFSISLWVRAAAMDGPRVLITKDNVSTDRVFSVGVPNSEGAVRFTNYFDANTPTSLTTDPAALQVDTWRHIVTVWDDENERQTIYVDGAMAATIARPGIHQFAGDSTLKIGILDDLDEDDLYFSGLIDEVWLFDEPLGSAQVQALYGFNAIPTPTGLGALIAAAAFGLRRRRAGRTHEFHIATTA